MLNILKKKISLIKDIIPEDKFPIFINEFHKILLEEGKLFYFKEKEQKEKEKKQFKTKIMNIFLKKILAENIVNKNNISKIELKQIFISIAKELNEMLKSFIEDYKEKINKLIENDNESLETILIESFFENEQNINLKNISEQNYDKTYIISLINCLYYAKQCDCIDVIQSKTYDLNHLLPNVFISIELLCKILNFQITLQNKNEKIIILSIKISESLIVLSQELYENVEMIICNYIFEQNLLKTFIFEASSIQKLRIYIYEFLIRYFFLNKEGGQKINNLSLYLEENKCIEILLTSITLSFLNQSYSNIYELFNEIFLFLITYILYKKETNFSDYYKDKLITLINFIFESEMEKEDYEDILIPFINKILIIDYVTKEELKNLDIFRRTESEILQSVNTDNLKHTYIINLLLKFINANLEPDISLKSKKIILSSILKDLNNEKYKKLLQETDFYKIVIEKLYSCPEEIIIRVFNFLIFQYENPERDSNLTEIKKENSIKSEIKSIIQNIDKINDENTLKIILKQFQQFISLNSSFQKILCFQGIIFNKLKEILNKLLNKLSKSDFNNLNGNILLSNENRYLKNKNENEVFTIKKEQTTQIKEEDDFLYSCEMIENLINFIEILINNNEENFNLLSGTGIFDSYYYSRFCQGNYITEKNSNNKSSIFFPINYKAITYRLWCLEMIYDNNNSEFSLNKIGNLNQRLKYKDEAILYIYQRYIKIKQTIENIIKNESNGNENYEDIIKNYLQEINLMNESIGIKFYKNKDFFSKKEKALFDDIIFDFPNLIFQIMKNKNNIVNKEEIVFDLAKDAEKNDNEREKYFEHFIHNIIKDYIIILFNIIQNSNSKIFKIFIEDISSKIYVPLNRKKFKEIFFKILNIYLKDENNIKNYFRDIEFFIIENAIDKSQLFYSTTKYLKFNNYNYLYLYEETMDENENKLDLSSYYAIKFDIPFEILENNDKNITSIYINNAQVLIFFLKFLVKNKLFNELKEYILFLYLLIKINENNCYSLLSFGLINTLIKLWFIILENEEEKSEILNIICDIFISTIPNLDCLNIELLINCFFISLRYPTKNSLINEFKIELFLKFFQNFNNQLKLSRKTKHNIIFSNLNSRQPNIYNILFSCGICFNSNSKEVQIYNNKDNKLNSNYLSIYITTRFYNIDDSNFILFKLEKNIKEKDKNPLLFSIYIDKKQLIVKDSKEKIIGQSKDISNQIQNGKYCNFLITINTESNKLEIFLKRERIFNEISNFKDLNLNDSECSYNIILGFPGTSIRDIESSSFKSLSYVELSYLLIYVDNFEYDFKEKQFSLSKISSSKNGSITAINIPIEYLNYKTYKTFVPSNIGKKHDLLKVDLKIDISKVVYELIVDKLEIISNKTLKDYTGDYYFVNNFINRMQRNYYMDIIDKKFIVYIPNTNYKTLSQELSYNKHTFLLSKTKFCDSILFNQIYNQENLFEDILTKNIFSKHTLNYILKGFNFVEIILICLNDCILIKNEEKKKEILYTLLKTLSIYLIQHLSLLNNFSKSNNFKILIYLLVKNAKFLNEECLEIFFLLSYGLEEKTNIQLLDPWYPEIIINLILDISLFKELSIENKKYIIERLKEVIAPTMSNEPDYDFKILIVEKLYQFLIIGNTSFEIDSLIASIITYIIEQCLKTKKGFKEASENQLNKIINLSLDYLIITDCFSNHISQALSKRNFNNQELEETTNVVKQVFTKLYSDDIKPIRTIIFTFFPKLNDDFQTLFISNNTSNNDINESSNFISRNTTNTFYKEQANKMQNLLSKIIDYDKDEYSFSDEDNKYLNNFLDSKIKYNIKFMKYIFLYKQLMKTFFYNLYLKFRHISFISKYISEECKIKYSWYIYNREGLSRIKNKLKLKNDSFTDEEIIKSYSDMLTKVNQIKNGNEISEKSNFRGFLQTKYNNVDLGFFKINNIMKTQIWLDQIFQKQIINLLIDEDDIIHSFYNCLLFKGIDYYTCVFIIGKKKIYILKNFHIDDNGILYMNNGNTNNASQTDCFKKYFWAIKNYENELKEHCNYLNIKNINEKQEFEDDFYFSQNDKFSIKRCEVKIYKFDYFEINEIHKRRFLYQENSIEIFLKNGKNYMLSFNIDKREQIFSIIISNLQDLLNSKKNNNYKLILNNKVYAYLRKSNIFLKKGKTKNQKLEKKLIDRKTLLDKSTEFWSNNLISNYDYIMILNTLSGRTYNDLSQYPIYPWIIKQYNSELININDENIYRDLKYPIFAQENETRLKLKLKFDEVDDDEGKYFSGTHYSNPGFVSYYLIRQKPYSIYASEIQGGYFDTPDRLFYDIKNIWDVSEKFQELIPEMFYLSESLVNYNNFNFGQNQFHNYVNDVILPNWAKNNFRFFIKVNKKYLESYFVSEKLSDWIDLIFGYKQSGKDSIEYLNVYRKACYSFNVNNYLNKELDNLKLSNDENLNKKEISKVYNSLEDLMNEICEMGQNPIQLFNKPHIKREKQKYFSLINKAIFLLNFNLINKKKEERIKISSNIINDCKRFEEIEDNNISKGEGGLSSFRSIFTDNESSNKQKNAKNYKNSFIFAGEKVILLGNKFINYLDYSYSKYSFRIVKPFSKVIMEFQTYENFPISVINVSKNGKYIFIGYENGKIIKYKLRKDKDNKVYYPNYEKKGNNKILNKIKLNKIFNKKSQEDKDNKSMDQNNNKENLGRKSTNVYNTVISNKNFNALLKRTLITSNKNLIYDDDDIIENFMNKNEKIKLEKSKEQMPTISFINSNIDNISNNYFIFYKNETNLKPKKDFTKGTSYYKLSTIISDNDINSKILLMNICESFSIIIIVDIFNKIYIKDMYSLKTLHFIPLNKITKSENNILSVKICNQTGDFIIVTPDKIIFFNINGIIISILDISEDIINGNLSPITICEIKSLKYIESDILLFTGHLNGNIILWKLNVDNKESEIGTDVFMDNNKNSNVKIENEEYLDMYRYSLDENYLLSNKKKKLKTRFVFLKLIICDSFDNPIKYFKFTEDLIFLVVDNNNNIYFFEYEDYLDELKKPKKITKNCVQCGSSIKNSKIFCQFCNQKLCPKCKIEIEIPELTLKTLKPVCEKCEKIISNTNSIFYDF